MPTVMSPLQVLFSWSLAEFTCSTLLIRHGPEVPKFVFMAVCFETHGHAKSLAQFIIISVGSANNVNHCVVKQNAAIASCSRFF